MNRVRIKYLIVALTIVAIAIFGVGCNLTRSPTTITVVVADHLVPQPTEQIEVTPIIIIGVTGETGTIELWCEEEYCYRTEYSKNGGTCRRVERDARFDTAEDETLRDNARRQVALTQELIDKGDSTPCARTGGPR